MNTGEVAWALGTVAGYLAENPDLPVASVTATIYRHNVDIHAGSLDAVAMWAKHLGVDVISRMGEGRVHHEADGKIDDLGIHVFCLEPTPEATAS